MDNLGVNYTMATSSFVEEIKEPFDSGRKRFVDGQDRCEEVVDKLLNGAFGGKQSREEYLRNSLMGALSHLVILVVMLVDRPHQVVETQRRSTFQVSIDHDYGRQRIAEVGSSA